MSEHKHEWQAAYDFTAECVACDAILNMTEIERRLNATEVLSIQSAEMAADFLKMEEGYKWNDEGADRAWNLHEEFDALMAYAAARESE